MQRGEIFVWLTCKHSLYYLVKRFRERPRAGDRIEVFSIELHADFRD